MGLHYLLMVVDIHSHTLIINREDHLMEGRRKCITQIKMRLIQDRLKYKHNDLSIMLVLLTLIAIVKDKERYSIQVVIYLKENGFLAT